MSEKLIKLNDSEKTRKTSSIKVKKGGILPDTYAHTGGVSQSNFSTFNETQPGEPGCGDKVKKHKFKILGIILILVLALVVLGITIHDEDKPPGPGPTPVPPTPPVPPPVPPNKNYNMYFLSPNDTVLNQRHMVSGKLRFQIPNVTLADEEATEGNSTIKMNPLNTSLHSLIPIGPNNDYIKNVSFSFSQVDYKVTKVSFTDADKERFSIPDDIVPSLPDNDAMTISMSGFQYQKEPFGFEFRSTWQQNVSYVHTNNSDFVFTDKFMQLDLQIPSQRIYGLGERSREFSLEQGTWTMWANGRNESYDDGTGGKQTYGVHPFALVQTQSKTEWIGIFFRNANAQSPVITNKANNTSTLTYVTTGGQLEMYFFTKGNAKQIIKAYQNMIGKPQLPPFWALGWHAASAGYSNLSMYDEVVKKYAQNEIPLEGIFLDTAYMQTDLDFTVDSTNFSGLKEWAQDLHTKGQKLMIILNAALQSNSLENKYYSQALDQEVLLKTSINKNARLEEGILTQQINGVKSVFLDFLEDEALNIWKAGIKDLFALVPFDGLWLGMNEATGSCNGECPKGLTLPFREDHTKVNNTWFDSWSNQDTSSTYYLPFSPGPDTLDFQSLSLNGTHKNGMTEYDLHSLFGAIQSKKTKEIITTYVDAPLPDKRSFIVSRSTFAGSGSHVQHYLGENKRNWQDMQFSISGVMNFNMYGIPMSGPVTCGYYEDKSLNETEQRELCARWIQLASFYPFAWQNHANKAQGGADNEPYNLGGPTDNSTIWSDMAKQAITDRLGYIRHIYTCLFTASIEGGSCFDPLLMHFPEVEETFSPNQTEHSFLVGDSLKITPALTSGAEMIDSYFPEGCWVNMKDYSKVICTNSTDGWRKVNASEGINIHLRPGHMVLHQPCRTMTGKNCMTTNDIRDFGKYSLVVNRETESGPNHYVTSGHAQGKVFIDEDDSISKLDSGEYQYYEFLMSTNSLKKWNLNKKQTKSIKKLDEIVIVNAHDLAGTDFACWISETDAAPTVLNFNYDSENQTLTIKPYNNESLDLTDMRDIHFGNLQFDLNVCEGPNAHYYHPYNNTLPDLSGNEVVVQLEPMDKNKSDWFRALNMTLRVLNTTKDLDPHETQKAVNVSVLNIFWSYSHIGVYYKDPYFVPDDIVHVDRSKLVEGAKLSDWVNWNQNANGSFTIDVKNSQGTIIYTMNGDLQMRDYTNHINAVVNTYSGKGLKEEFKGLIGPSFQEKTDDLFLKTGTYSLWTNEKNSAVHPFFMGKAEDRTWFGIYYNLVAAQDWYVRNDIGNGEVSLKMRAAGGTGDLFFMMEDLPQNVTKSYHTIVGYPFASPQWALGWHHSKQGYQNTQQVNDTVQGYFQYKLPIETLWLDNDYMYDNQNFVWDKVNFKGIKGFIENYLHSHDIKFIPVIDGGDMALRKSFVDPLDKVYDLYERSFQNIWLKSSKKESIFDDERPAFIGQNLAVDCVYFDWTSSTAKQVWKSAIKNFLNFSVLGETFDGYWLNMNQAQNKLCNGTCYDNSEQSVEDPVQWKLPYIPTQNNLEINTLPLDAAHADGNIQLDTHSLFATMQTKVSFEVESEFSDKRQLFFSKSSSAGLGKFGTTYLGDIESNTANMGNSVTSTMSNSILGMPLTGADVCGSIGDVQGELCARWYTVAAFQPFARNHNNIGFSPQEPWVFNQVYQRTVTYLDIIQNAMYTKLHLIRYFNTQLTRIQTRGGTFYKPMFFDYHNEDEAYKNQQNNVLLGPALKLGVMATATGVNTTNYFFPAGRWCEVICHKGVDCCFTQETSGQKEWPALANDYALHLIEGNIIPMQDATTIAGYKKGSDPSKYVQLTTTTLQTYPVDFHIMPTCANETLCAAKGEYINDDGILLNQTIQNIWQLEYTMRKPTNGNTTMSLYVYAEQPTKEYTHLNNNDILGRIEIYDAAAHGFDKLTYEATFNFFLDLPRIVLPCTYDQRSDRLIVDSKEAPDHEWVDFLMLQLDNVSFDVKV